MSDVIETEQVAEEVAEEVVDPLAAREAALAEKEANLKKFEAKLQREATERGLKKVEPAAEETVEGLDPAAEKVLADFIERKYGTTLAQAQTAFEAQISEAEAQVTAFCEKSDAPGEDIIQTLTDYNLWPKNPTTSAMKDALKRAEKLVKSATFDADAEVERKVAEKLEALKADGAEVVNIEPKRGAVKTDKRTPQDIMDDTSLSMQDRWRELAALKAN